jgi:hypothetical protein
MFSPRLPLVRTRVSAGGCDGYRSQSVKGGEVLPAAAHARSSILRYAQVTIWVNDAYAGVTRERGVAAFCFHEVSSRSTFYASRGTVTVPNVPNNVP